MDLLKTLNDKILINDLIVKKMKYEINMLFRDYPSKEKADLLAIKINNQLDSALKGQNSDDKEQIRKLLIINSFMVIPNPVSDHINYGHVFTTLTNYDEAYTDTKERLSSWLDYNTDLEYDETDLNQYIKRYKIKGQNAEIKVSASVYEPVEKKYKYRLKKKVLLIPLSFILLILFILFTKTVYKEPEKLVPNEISTIEEFTPNTESEIVIESLDKIDEIYRYHPIEKIISDFLRDRESLLVEGDYLEILDQYAKDYDISPLLLIAIIGQEQAYVPKDHEYALEIIKNPYNVFGSWVDYNSTFKDSTTICLNTIQSSIDTYESGDFIDWLNTTYAEDKKWSTGVKDIFTMLHNLTQE